MAMRGSAVVSLVLAVLLAASAARAATPTPAANADVTLAAQPMLGGVVAAGSWLAVRVDVENRGPAIVGELRLAPSSGQGSTYGLKIELPSGARQQHFLYTQAGVFGARFDVSLVTGQTVHASVRVVVAETPSPRIYVLAERPERLVGPLGDALETKGSVNPKLVAIGPGDLPPRAEPWAAIDLLVWHDVASASLDPGQLVALETWLATGGDLLLIGGSLGPPMFNALPEDILPYQPRTTITLEPADLATMLGELPAGAGPIPALAGPLRRGAVIWSGQSADSVVAARQVYGQGSVTLLGIDPSAGWLAGSLAEDNLWQRTVPNSAAFADAGLPTDNGFMIEALGQLPAIGLPAGNQLLLLILAYIVAIGPLNYLVLRRRDRREWGWLTMPLIIAGFGVGAYGIGIAQRGGSVVVNELVVVEGAAGSDRGRADVHVGVFSPGRGTFDLRVGPAPLISATTTSGDPRTNRPLDVLLGNPATLRGFGVNFGAIRAFRAETAVDTPRVDADLELVDGTLSGTIINSSAVALEDVSLVYGGTALALGDVGPGQSRPIVLTPAERNQFDEPLWAQLYPFGGTAEAADSRVVAARRALLQHLTGGWDQRPATQTIFGQGPVILAWLPAGLLDVSVATGAERVGQTVYVLPARVAIAGSVVFSGGLLEPTVEAVDSPEGFKEGSVYYLTRGTLTVDYRPLAFEGSLTPNSLGLRLGLERATVPTATGTALVLLPAAEQPDSDLPLATSPRPGEGSPEVPRLQLFDRVAASWVEFEPIDFSVSYLVPDPQRYVDASGAFRLRFVVRSDDFVQFAVSARLDGVIE